MKEDSRVGLVFDGTYESCSDLSDSHRSFEWHENLTAEPEHDALVDLRTSLENDEDIEVCRTRLLSSDGAVVVSFDRQSTPQTPSFRSRRSPTDLSPGYPQLESDTDHTHRKPNRPRHPSIRLCMLLFASTFVLLSLIPHINSNQDPAEELSEQLRREEVPFPLYVMPEKTILHGNQLEQNEVRGVLRQDLLSLDQMNGSQGAEQQTDTKRRHQPNIAMARKQEQRPVFGSIDSHVERFILDDSSKVAKPSLTSHRRRTEDDDDQESFNLIVWLGGVALVAALFEYSHKKLYPRHWNDYLETHRSL